MAAKTPVVVPSLLAGDLSRLGEQLDSVKAAGCSWVSVDVMDGHFVPNLSFGPDFVILAKKHGFFVDAHLMVANPEAAAPWFASAGADIVTVHVEAVKDVKSALRGIRALGRKAGLAAKPRTPIDAILAVLDECDLALVMAVEPGFGGQKFMADMMPKVSALRAAVDARGLDCWVQVDGGVGLLNISQAVAAGADSLVAGSAVFGEKDPVAAFRALEAKARAADGD
ncbi:MAG TPA: ribulose-phosphate 3-epimerase [Elusimicrobia bacterium]|nr:MAG: ribulose-phosphate 3-epimerase [Elusimicrobia bacterium GWA2_66_18]OGR76005.1 MAG: ribulose-phosphate 3-epimerase [Elusimicrobia bacterium GWC2_65_9]HAZ08377.1 ribulose-phosphate 3-epimerase [Elusimicrobiota bacterium]